MGIQINGQTDTISAVDNNFSLAGNVSIGGTLTYEDVTSVDAVGLSTFKAGIQLDDSITHLGDTNTKIRFPADDTVTVETAGSERVRITSDGKVGVNQTSWTSKNHMFEVKQSTNDKEIARFTVDGASGSVQGRGYIGLSAFLDTVYPHAWIGVEEDTNASYRGDLIFGTRGSASDSAPTEKLRITSGGNVRVPDNGKFTAGAGDDLQIYHDGSHNRIKSLTGGLYLHVANGEFLSQNGSEVIAKFLQNAAVELYHDNSKKFETTTTGATITSDLILNHASGDKAIRWATGGTNKWSLYHNNGAGALIAYDNANNAERLRITSGGDVSISSDGTVHGVSKLTILPANRTSAFSASDGDTWHDVVLNQTGSATNNAVGIAFETSTSGYHKNAGTGIAAVKNGTNSDYGSDLVFITRPQSAVAQERLRITSDGKIGLQGNTTPVAKLHIGTENNGALSAQTLFVEGAKTGFANYTGLPQNQLCVYDNTASTAGSGGAISFGADCGGGQQTWIAAINSVRESNSNDASNYAGGIAFWTRPAQSTPLERMRVTNNGLTFNGDTAAANALDDYEEGTLNWRLQRANAIGSGSNQGDTSIRYTKIGNRVYVSGYLYTQNTGSSTGTNVELRSNSNTANDATLPYVPNQPGGFPITGTRTIDDTYRNLAVTFRNGQSKVYIYTDDGDNNYLKSINNVSISSAQTHLVIQFCGSYTTNS